MATIQVFGDNGEWNGTEESDNFIVFGGTGNTLNGLGGSDIMSASSGNNTTMNGDDGNDLLRGKTGDTFNGGANNDSIDLTLQDQSSAITADLENVHNGIGVAFGGVFVEDMESGLISFGTGNDTVTASSGASIFIYGYDGNDRLTGDTGADSMGGGNGVDVLDGMGGDDLLYAFAPENFGAYNSSAARGSPDEPGTKNFLNGGDGNDVMVAATGDDFFDGGAGIDTVSYDPDTEIAPGVKIDLKRTLQETVGSGLDRISNVENVDGSGGDDILRGDGGANSLNGGVGNDLLSGGGGDDTLRGSDGNDRFIYKSLAAMEGDRVVDLDSNDFLDLRGIDADTTQGGNQKFKVVDVFHGKAGELLLTYDAGSNLTTVFADVDGDGVSDGTFAINGQHTTNQDNFIL